MKLHIFNDNIVNMTVNMTVMKFKNSNFIKINFSCHDLVSDSISKKIHAKLIIFDRFIDIESNCEIRHQNQINYLIFIILMKSTIPIKCISLYIS